MKKIGILGGTFNPIHNAHLSLGYQAYEELNLDKIWVMPSKNPPHKTKSQILDDDNRCHMIELAIDGYKDVFELSRFELLREGTTYTAETLTLLTKQYSENEYYFILGEDSLLAIEKWYKPDIILKLANLVVAVRNNSDIKNLKLFADYLEIKYNARIHILEMPNIEISSSQIRKSFIEKNSCNPFFVPKSVYEYLLNNRIYTD